MKYRYTVCTAQFFLNYCFSNCPIYTMRRIKSLYYLPLRGIICLRTGSACMSVLTWQKGSGQGIKLWSVFCCLGRNIWSWIILLSSWALAECRMCVCVCVCVCVCTQLLGSAALHIHREPLE